MAVVESPAFVSVSKCKSGNPVRCARCADSGSENVGEFRLICITVSVLAAMSSPFICPCNNSVTCTVEQCA